MPQIVKLGTLLLCTLVLYGCSNPFTSTDPNNDTGITQNQNSGPQKGITTTGGGYTITRDQVDSVSALTYEGYQMVLSGVLGHRFNVTGQEAYSIYVISGDIATIAGYFNDYLTEYDCTMLASSDHYIIKSTGSGDAQDKKDASGVPIGCPFEGQTLYKMNDLIIFEYDPNQYGNSYDKPIRIKSIKSPNS